MMKQLCGVRQVKKFPMEPYSELVCDFLDNYSVALRKDSEAKQYPDVITFAFWARKANILKKKQEFLKRHDKQIWIGRGIVFHIAPSNIPINFIFSYAFGLLAGNSNIVRVPSKSFPQVECMCRVLEQVLLQEKYKRIYEMTCIVRYEQDKAITDEFSQKCNVRVIWGGDTTIEAVRESKLPSRSTEITFADRYSFGILNAKRLLESSLEEKQFLAEQFYNDTYLMDQNACSTPHLICWQLDGVSQAEWEMIQEEFWNQVQLSAGKYKLEDIKVSEKYLSLCEEVICNDTIKRVKIYSNLLYVCELSCLDEKAITSVRGKYGLFFQYCLKDEFNELRVFSNEKVQTCAYYGVDVKKLTNDFITNGYSGVDRIVPFGKTLDIDLIWDGYDLITQMSRIIQMEI